MARRGSALPWLHSAALPCCWLVYQDQTTRVWLFECAAALTLHLNLYLSSSICTVHAWPAVLATGEHHATETAVCGTDRNCSPKLTSVTGLVACSAFSGCLTVMDGDATTEAVRLVTAGSNLLGLLLDWVVGTDLGARQQQRIVVGYVKLLTHGSPCPSCGQSQC